MHYNPPPHHLPKKYLPHEGDYFAAPHRYYNDEQNLIIINVRSGEYYVTEGMGEMMVTVLGSCIATCIFDPVAKVAGMNHFLMPGDCSVAASPKYGIFAMEYMINEILKRGAVKTRLIVKVFGGANMLANTSLKVGDKNVAFIQEYLANESLIIAASDIGGECARRIHFYGDNGKVMQRKLIAKSDIENVVREETHYSHDIDKRKNKPTATSIELFGN